MRIPRQSCLVCNGATVKSCCNQQCSSIERQGQYHYPHCPWPTQAAVKTGTECAAGSPGGVHSYINSTPKRAAALEAWQQSRSTLTGHPPYGCSKQKGETANLCIRDTALDVIVHQSLRHCFAMPLLHRRLCCLHRYLDKNHPRAAVAQPAARIQCSSSPLPPAQQ